MNISKESIPTFSYKELQLAESILEVQVTRMFGQRYYEGSRAQREDYRVFTELLQLVRAETMKREDDALNSITTDVALKFLGVRFTLQNGRYYI